MLVLDLGIKCFSVVLLYFLSLHTDYRYSHVWQPSSLSLAVKLGLSPLWQPYSLWRSFIGRTPC